MTSKPLSGLPLMLLVAGSIGALIFGAVLAASMDSAWWLLAGPVAILVNVVYITILRQRASRDHQSDHTGRTVTPPPGAVARPTPATWTGGANMAGALGRMNATMPLAVLDVSANNLTLRVRPAAVGAAFGMKAITATPLEVEEVFPVKGRMGASGVGILVRGEPVAYFWTRQGHEVLLTLANLGYPTSWQEQRPHLW